MMERLTRYVPMIILCLSFASVQGAKRWAGGSTGAWVDMSSWVPAGIPGSGDSVLLDNAWTISNYTVTLPEDVVTVRTLVIEPGAGKTILLVIPAASAARPALVVTGSGDALIIRSGGILRNSSGLASGESIQIGGSFCLFNGGRYIHNTRSSHAVEIVGKLSIAPGTEKGIFEFDVPGGSYPLSLSNRTYGTLVLSSASSGGTQTYNASGTNPIVINGNLQIGNGVQFNLDITKDVIIHGNYIQDGGVFNVASQPNNNAIVIQGNLTQDASGMITETSSGLPVIELAGNLHQEVALAGAVTNSVTLRINNSEGATLKHPLVVGYKIELLSGKLLTSRSSCLIVLDDGVMEGGSSNSFVEGPVSKKGDDDFEFPVGRQGDYAPVKISGANGAVSDEFLAEYYLDNPIIKFGSSVNDPAIVRISTLEYWNVERIAGGSAKKVTLPVSTYSSATALQHLVVAGWNFTTWLNGGNSFYQGIATGKVTSEDRHQFGVFTLASTAQQQNPLDLKGLTHFITTDSNTTPVQHVALDSIRMFPTIVKQAGKLNLNTREGMLVFVQINNAHGRPLRSMKLYLKPGNNLLEIDMDDFMPGMYIIQIQSLEKSRSLRFVVAR